MHKETRDWRTFKIKTAMIALKHTLIHIAGAVIAIIVGLKISLPS